MLAGVARHSRTTSSHSPCVILCLCPLFAIKVIKQAASSKQKQQLATSLKEVVACKEILHSAVTAYEVPSHSSEHNHVFHKGLLRVEDHKLIDAGGFVNLARVVLRFINRSVAFIINTFHFPTSNVDHQH